MSYQIDPTVTCSGDHENHDPAHATIEGVTIDHRRPTLQQVALRAGVSRSTAGAALAGSSRVAPSTVRRVRDAALALGYRTEPHARQLRRGGPELANIVLDTRLTHSADGSLHPFWARVLTGFLATMQHAEWLCAVQLQQPGVPLLPAPSPGVVLATSDTGKVSLFVHDTFGQTVVSPVDSCATHDTHLCLHHDFEAIGRACADHFSTAGCTRILLAGRQDFAYSDAIVKACALRCQELGISTAEASGTGTAQRIRTNLTDDINGLLDLTAEPAEIAQGLLGRAIVAHSPAPGDVVVITNADGRDPIGRSAMARLSLEGHAVGVLAAEFFLTAIEGAPDLKCPTLPFAIYASTP